MTIAQAMELLKETRRVDYRIEKKRYTYIKITVCETLKTTDAYEVKPLQKMKGRRRTTIFRPGLMSNLIIYYKLINYKCMDNIMKCTPLGEQKSLWLRKTLLIMKFFVLFYYWELSRVGQVSLIHRM